MFASMKFHASIKGNLSLKEIELNDSPLTVGHGCEIMIYTQNLLSFL